MSYLEELLPEFRKGAKIRMKDWVNFFYYQMKNGKIYNQDGHIVKKFSRQAVFEDVWEFYQEPIDWDYIIKNKCLCWFWNKEERNKTAGVLEDYDTDGAYLREYDCYYDNCCPVRRDEVNFYTTNKGEKEND